MITARKREISGIFELFQVFARQCFHSIDEALENFRHDFSYQILAHYNSYDAKFTPDGDIIFLGRQSGFIKIRGLRVDLSEVEHAINSTASARRSAVVLSETEGSDVELVAFVETTEKNQAKLADEMHDRLSEILPPYMILSVFIPVEKLPLTTSKKLD